ncbi:hypothetical protein FOZ61_005853 [Perkinsus olseni]|uniref:Anaphase-promoting complex subunit 4-like WD40 domain-containing protein n=1 Tax=Perkinsus olseni TaxID=32597 RepID=A0A7J6LFN1_PEROL|nr:hypothetical protein FOZ61_005853 [Perkinsus olseni]
MSLRACPESYIITMAAAATEARPCEARGEDLVEAVDATPELIGSIMNPDDDEVLERVAEEGFEEGSGDRRSPLEAEVRVRPPVVDDFIRNFFIKHGLKRSLDAFQNEWYSLQLSGKLNPAAMDDETVPDLYLRSQQLMDVIRAQEAEMKKLRIVAENAKSLFDKLRQQRDFHRMHHRRVVQEKEKLISDFKRLRSHYEQYEPTLTELRHKYEVAMKEKFLLKMERDRYMARASALERQIDESGPTEGVTGEQSADGPSGRSAAGGAGPSGEVSSQRSPRAGRKGDTPWPTEAAARQAAADFTQRMGEDPPAMDVTSLRLARTFKAHDEGLCKVALHPRIPMVATTSDDGTWKLWSLPDGEAFVSDLAFHPEGSVFVTTGGDRTVKVWDVIKEMCLATLTDHSETVWSADYHQSGGFFATSSTDQTVKIFDSKSLRCRQTLRGHVDAVNTVQFQPFTGNLATASADKTASIWDMRTGLCVQTFYGHRNALNHARFDRKGMYLASADADGIVKVWDLRMVAEILQIDTGNMPANEVDWDTSGKVIAVASMDSSVKLFDVWEKKFLIALEGHEDSVQSVSFESGGEPPSRYLVSVTTIMTVDDTDLPRFTEVPEDLEVSEDARSDLSTEKWNSDDEPPIEEVNDRMVISRDGSLIRTVMKVGRRVDGLDRPGRYDKVDIKYLEVPYGEVEPPESAWADRATSLEFEVGSCDPGVPSAIDVGVRYMGVGSECGVESSQSAWRLPYRDQADLLQGKSSRPSKKRFQFMAAPPTASLMTTSAGDRRPVAYLIQLVSVKRCYVLRDDGLLRRWILRSRDPRMAWKASPKVGDTVAIVKASTLLHGCSGHGFRSSLYRTVVGEVARIEVSVPGSEETVDELELRDVFPHGWVCSPRDGTVRMLEKQEVPQSMGLPLSRTLVVEEDSVVTVGVTGPFGLRTAMVLQWTYGRYIVHPIFDAMVRSMRVGERAIFTPLPGADIAYLCDERLSVSCDLGLRALSSGNTLEEAISNYSSSRAPDVTSVPSLTVFDSSVCEMVLVTVSSDEQGDTSGEAVLSRSRLRKDIGNRLLAVDALQEARSEYMSALDGLKVLHKAPHEKPSKDQEALELAANLNLSLVCLKQGDHPEAQRFATRAKELDPDNIKARYRLALALIEQRKEEDRAVHILEGILERCPEARGLLSRVRVELRADRRREKKLFESMFR